MTRLLMIAHPPGSLPLVCHCTRPQWGATRTCFPSPYAAGTQRVTFSRAAPALCSEGRLGGALLWEQGRERPGLTSQRGSLIPEQPQIRSPVCLALCQRCLSCAGSSWDY